MKIKNLLLSSIAILALSGCGGGDDSSTAATGGSSTSSNLNGVAVDGYLSGSTVCLDLNNDSTCNSDEPSTTTDTDGKYSLSYNFTSDEQRANTNLIVFGGIDMDTEKAFEGQLSSSIEGSNEINITPITTAVVALRVNGRSLIQAKRAVAKMFNISESDLGVDPTLSAREGRMEKLIIALELQKAVEMIVAVEGADLDRRAKRKLTRDTYKKLLSNADENTDGIQDLLDSAYANGDITHSQKESSKILAKSVREKIEKSAKENDGKVTGKEMRKIAKTIHHTTSTLGGQIDVDSEDSREQMETIADVADKEAEEKLAQEEAERLAQEIADAQAKAQEEADEQAKAKAQKELEEQRKLQAEANERQRIAQQEADEARAEAARVQAQQERDARIAQAQREKAEADRQADIQAKKERDAQARIDAQAQKDAATLAEKNRLAREAQAKREADAKAEKERIAKIEADNNKATTGDYTVYVYGTNNCPYTTNMRNDLKDANIPFIYKDIGIASNKQEMFTKVSGEVYLPFVDVIVDAKSSKLQRPSVGKVIGLVDPEEYVEPVKVSATVLTKTGQTESYKVGDDGYYQNGRDNIMTRSNNAVTDSATNLMWDDTPVVYKPWITEASHNAKDYRNTSGDTAKTYCSNLKTANHNDWRVPTTHELRSIMDMSAQTVNRPFQIHSAFQSLPRGDWLADYWAAEDTWQADRRDQHWQVDFSTGTTSINNGSLRAASVRCVRAAN